MSDKSKYLVDEIVHKFDTEENSYFKLGSITGEVDEKGKDIGTVGSLLNKIKVNPDDAASQKYLKAFIGNLAFEGVAGGIFGAAKYGISRVLK